MQLQLVSSEKWPKQIEWAQFCLLNTDCFSALLQRSRVCAPPSERKGNNR